MQPTPLPQQDMTHGHPVAQRLPGGAGLGLRRTMLAELFADGHLRVPRAIDFFEIAPENWINQGGLIPARFAEIASQHTIVCHGLSLNLGGYAPLDQSLISDIRCFMQQHHISLYTEHLAYTGDHAHLYDLLPIPRSAEAVKHVATRIRQVQDALGQRIAIENASTYTGTPLDTLTEWDFYLAVAEEADCNLHLDVNNIYVNAVNFRYDPQLFLDAVATRARQRVIYLHMAGHYLEAPDLLIDTHGAPVCEPVWNLLAATYQCLGQLPTLLERDFNIPPVAELIPEIVRIKQLQQHAPVAST